MFIAFTIGAIVVAIFLLLVLLWLFATIDDWSRDLTTNFATTSASAKKRSLHPIISQRLAPELADLVTTAARQLSGWKLAGRDDTSDEITLRLVRTTRLMRFKDDITVYIRPAGGNQPRTNYEISAESQSRVGKGDFGQNPRNLAELMDTIRTLLR
ncbi:MAG: DUF1499 domain-containing protein [Pirellulaceae bacterium]|nr:DUF1499 domain-containing protein [Pirellulaceae bacterium]